MTVASPVAGAAGGYALDAFAMSQGPSSVPQAGILGMPALAGGAGALAAELTVRLGRTTSDTSRSP